MQWRKLELVGRIATASGYAAHRLAADLACLASISRRGWFRRSGEDSLTDGEGEILVSRGSRVGRLAAMSIASAVDLTVNELRSFSATRHHGSDTSVCCLVTYLAPSCICRSGGFDQRFVHRSSIARPILPTTESRHCAPLWSSRVGARASTSVDGFVVTLWTISTSSVAAPEVSPVDYAGLRSSSCMPAPRTLGISRRRTFTDRVAEAQQIVDDLTRPRSGVLRTPTGPSFSASTLRTLRRATSSTGAHPSSVLHTGEPHPGNVAQHEGRVAVRMATSRRVAVGRSSSTSPDVPEEVSGRYPDAESGLLRECPQSSFRSGPRVVSVGAVGSPEATSSPML